MNQVLDYSAGFPGAGAIKGAGYAGAVRYIGFPDRRKCTTRNELNDFSANQLGMALVFENSTTDWRGGFGTGQTSARRARDHADYIGFPADRPIYMAVDRDVVTSGEFGTMIEYLRGASTSLGGVHVTGVYGEADVIDRARDAGVAAWFWQTAAWSHSRRTAAHLFQRIGTVNVGGVGCDINDVLQEDWGQHNYGANMELTTQNLKDIATYVGNEIKENLLNGDDPRSNFYGPDVMEDGTKIKRTFKQGLDQLMIWATAGTQAAQSADSYARAAANRPAGTFTDAQVADLALQIANAPFLRELPKDTATAVLEQAARRLAAASE